MEYYASERRYLVALYVDVQSRLRAVRGSNEHGSGGSECGGWMRNVHGWLYAARCASR